MATQVGDVELDVPRDRDGTFTPRLVPKGSRRLGGLDDMIISLYAGGMTVRDIEHHLASTIGTELSQETITKITDEVLDEVLAWQRRPLEAFYPVIYLDALVIKVRDGAHVRNKAAHIAVGVDMDGVKHVLGIWVQANEGAKFWAGVCAELANRGVKDVLIVCCDGLTGFPEAIEATWPQATVQTCVVHLIRAAMRFVNYNDRKAVAAALRPIYQAVDADGGRGRTRRVRSLDAGQAVTRTRSRRSTRRLGPVHPVPGVPARAAQGHLHDQRDRVAELPAAQDHQEPRALPQRRRRREAALARDLQHRGQARPRTRQRTRHRRRAGNAKPNAASSKARSPPTGNKPSPNSHWPTPTASTPTSNR